MFNLLSSKLILFGLVLLFLTLKTKTELGSEPLGHTLPLSFFFALLLEVKGQPLHPRTHAHVLSLLCIWKGKWQPAVSATDSLGAGEGTQALE